MYKYCMNYMSDQQGLFLFAVLLIFTLSGQGSKGNRSLSEIQGRVRLFVPDFSRIRRRS